MKIIIVGFGKMGKSHMKSFINSKKNYKIDVVDNKKFFFINENINYYNKIPKSKVYDLAIISTSSREKFKIVNYILKYNKVNFLLLEKIAFSEVQEYQKTLKIFIKLKTNVMVNTWGQLIAPKFSKIIKKKTKVNFNIVNAEGDLMANLPHFLEFIKYFSNNDLKINFDQVKKLINSKWKSYKELLGTVIIKNNYISANVKTIKKLKKNKEDILITFKIKKNKFKFVLFKNSKCILYKNNKIIQKYFFPFFAYKISEKLFYKDYINYKKRRKFNYYNNFRSNSETAIKLIKLLKYKYKRKIFIT